MKKQMARLLAGTGVAALVAGLAGFSTQKVSAASTTADLAVSATVIANCRVAAGALAFGNYDPILTHDTAPLDADGTFQVRCTRGGTATLSLDTGDYHSGASRRMQAGGGQFLDYELYTTSGRTTVWDTANTVAFGPTPSSAYQDVTVFGRIPAGQDVVAGGYSDTVVITADF